MTSVMRSISPGSSSADLDDDYNVEYSFAIEYNGPPVSRDIPQVVPIDVHRIPTASVATGAVVLKNFSLPIIQPIIRSDQSSKKSSGELDSRGHFSKLSSSVKVYSRKPENCSPNESNVVRGAQTSSSSSTSGFFDCHDDQSRNSSGELNSGEHFGKLDSLAEVYSRKPENCSPNESNVVRGAQTSSSSSTSGFFDCHDDQSRNSSGEFNSGEHFGKLDSLAEVYSGKSENCSPNGSNVVSGAQIYTSSSTSGLLDCYNGSDHLSGSLDIDDDECKDGVLCSDVEDSTPTISRLKESTLRPQELSSEISSCETVEDSLVGPSGRTNRTPAVTFRDLPSSDGNYEESDYEEPEMYPSKPVVPVDHKKGLCHKCQKTNRFSEREFCIVCGAKYCKKCVLRAMGSMPEGRKCITCIGYRIDESKRGSLGKCSKMLKKLLSGDVVKKIMSVEISCEVNQLPPHLVFVNDKPLSIEELVSLQSCQNPPKKLRPGKYWYDKVSGFWGKDGEKPSQIISPQLALGYPIRGDASNGDTNVMINNRKITKPELWMLQAAGINCEGTLHFWVTADGTCQHEGMNNVLANLWERKRVKLLCAALSLPFLSDTSNAGDGDVDNDTDKDNKKIPKHKTTNKLLLIGCDQSGTSTIFKQAKIVYDVPFSDDEKQNIKFVIQRNVYHYLCILLDGHARFEEEFSIEMRQQRAEEPGPSEYSEQVDESNIYSFTPRLKRFSDWLLQVMISGNLEVIFPSATREYSPLVEELWKDKAFQATYNRRNELHTLPRVANYFLDRAVEITRIDYEPSQMDILHAEGITSSNGVASMEFSFPESFQDGYMESSGDNGPPISYQLIRAHASSLGENCKWLSMFEDVNLLIYCVSLTDYNEYYEDNNGARTNKMLATKRLFETIITHPTVADKEFLLVLNKFDLLEEKIEQSPLSRCEWFRDFNPVISHHPHSTSSGSNNPPLAQRAFHYIAVKFKRLFSSLSERKLFVSRATGFEPDSVDKAMKYCKEILKWSNEINSVSINEWSSDQSMEPSTDV